MAFHRYPITFAKLLIIAVLAYISLSGTGCNNIEGDKNMPFRDLDRNESLSTEIVNVKEYEAVGDGIKDDSSAITNAIAAASSSTLLLPAGTYRIGSNVIVPSDVTVWFANGAKLSIDSGVTLTLNGKLDAGLSQIFSGDGTVSIAKGSVEYLVPQWWGAVGNGTNDDTSAIQSALTCAELKTRHVYLPPGLYKTTTPLSLRYGTWLQGAGKSDVTTIKVTGGGNGINITRVIGSAIYEGARLSDFRIYSTTDVTGIGISINGDRDVLVENVWIGSWYTDPVANVYGFQKGVYAVNTPCYYTTIRNCSLYRNTYGVYIDISANESRIIENVIWYGNYGVYVYGTQGVKIVDNSIEGHALRGIYIENCLEPVVEGNRIESAGIRPIELGALTQKAVITGNTNFTNLGNTLPVLNNSGYDNHRLQNYQYPINYNNMSQQQGLAGVITAEYNNYNPTDIAMDAISGNLRLEARRTGSVVEVQSPLNIDSAVLNTPILGTGKYSNNHCRYSEAFGTWGHDGITVTDNAAIAPNGSLSASLARPTSSGDIVATQAYQASDVVDGTLCTFSVWLKSETEHQGAFYLLHNNTTIKPEYIWITPEWKQFYTTVVAHGTPTYFWLEIRPGSTDPCYMWGAQLTINTVPTSGTDNSVEDSDYRVVDTTKNFMASGVEIGGKVQANKPSNTSSSTAIITDIRSYLVFDTGSTAEPVIGTTITGSTSTATGVVTKVILTGGAWATNDATGYIEVNYIKKGVITAETITWSGGSANCISVKLNSILYCDDGFVVNFGGVLGSKNGDKYYAYSRADEMPKPYIKTTTTSITGLTTPSMTVPNLYVAGTIKALSGYLHGVVTSTGTYYWHLGDEIVIYNPTSSNIYMGPNEVFPQGYRITVINIGTYSCWPSGFGITVGPGECATFIYDGSNWRVEWLGQNDLTKDANVSFGTVNGAVYALTNASTITCNMYYGNAYTLSTTDAIGAVQINATGGTAGQMVTLIITDDSTGGHVVTFGSYFKPSGTLTGTASKTATVTFVKSGSYWYEVSRTTGL